MLEEDDIFGPGRPVVVSAEKHGELETEIEGFRKQNGRCVLKLRGINSISEAEKYVGHDIKIRRDTLPAAKEGWFYTFQLKGCRVVTTSGEYLGTVTDVLASGGNEVLKVDRDNKETLIPFAETYMRRIDPGQRRIEVELPEDLRDLNK
jgi:16S rRNA processing protein RimM